MKADENYRRLRELLHSLVDEFHGCKTGDCPHEKESDCWESLAQYAQESIDQARSDAAYAVEWRAPRFPRDGHEKDQEVFDRIRGYKVKA